jgi:hypothetical protein
MHQLARFSHLSSRIASAPKSNLSSITTRHRVSLLAQAPIQTRRWSTQAIDSKADVNTTHFANDKDMYLNTLKITDDCAKVSSYTMVVLLFYNYFLRFIAN